VSLEAVAVFFRQETGNVLVRGVEEGQFTPVVGRRGGHENGVQNQDAVRQQSRQKDEKNNGFLISTKRADVLAGASIIFPDAIFLSFFHQRSPKKNFQKNQNGQMIPKWPFVQIPTFFTDSSKLAQGEGPASDKYFEKFINFLINLDCLA
jgi:hypothetical protein